MAGFMIGAAQRRLPVVLDGVVTNAAALIAVKLAPGVHDYLLAAHGSTEPGAHVALEAMRLRPLLALGMRLGEGSGAALGLSLLKTSVDVCLGMATLESVITRAGLGHGS
jgi:nicotinate-nucleotide--dimethylbenzimidazole phosphoribosyltransferase